MGQVRSIGATLRGLVLRRKELMEELCPCDIRARPFWAGTSAVRPGASRPRLARNHDLRPDWENGRLGSGPGAPSGQFAAVRRADYRVRVDLRSRTSLFCGAVALAIAISILLQGRLRRQQALIAALSADM